MTEAAREQILKRIRTALGEPGSQPGVGDTLRMWQSSPPLHARPVAQPGDFPGRVEASGATWEQLRDASELQNAVLGYCQRWQVAQLVLMPEDSPLTALTWPPGRVHNGRPASTRSAVLTRACAGVAETGSVLLLSDTHHAAALNVLPEHLLVVLEMEHVVAHLEEALSPLGDGGMPWSACLVTGPSRTGDVEQTIELGAHGPRHVHLLLTPGTGL
jgi:L-lactate dehydrogenase complex protein LldG